MKSATISSKQRAGSRLEIAARDYDALRAQKAQIVQKIKSVVEEQEKIQDSLAKNNERLNAVVKAHPELRRMSLAVDKARDVIKSMGVERLTEIATYKNPPAKVKLVLQALVYVLTGKKLAWDKVLREMADDFIEKVLTLHWDIVSPEVIRTLKRDYLESPEWNIAKIYRASSATGPLADWIEGQVKILEFLARGGLDKAEVHMLITQKNKLLVEEQAARKAHQQLLEQKKNLVENIRALGKRKETLVANQNRDGGIEQKVKNFQRNDSNTSKVSESKEETPRRRQLSKTLHKKSAFNGNTGRTDQLSGRHRAETTPDREKSQSEIVTKANVELTAPKRGQRVMSSVDNKSALSYQRDRNKSANRGPYKPFDFTIISRSKSVNRNRTVTNLEFKGFCNKDSEACLERDKEKVAFGSDMQNPFISFLMEKEAHNRGFDNRGDTQQSDPLRPGDVDVNEFVTIGFDEPEVKALSKVTRPHVGNDTLEIIFNGKRITPEEYDAIRSRNTSAVNIESPFDKMPEEPVRVQNASTHRLRSTNTSRSNELDRSRSQSALSRDNVHYNKFSANEEGKPVWNVAANRNGHEYLQRRTDGSLKGVAPLYSIKSDLGPARDDNESYSNTSTANRYKRLDERSEHLLSGPIEPRQTNHVMLSEAGNGKVFKPSRPGKHPEHSPFQQSRPITSISQEVDYSYLDRVNIPKFSVAQSEALDRPSRHSGNYRAHK